MTIKQLGQKLILATFTQAKVSNSDKQIQSPTLLVFDDLGTRRIREVLDIYYS